MNQSPRWLQGNDGGAFEEDNYGATSSATPDWVHDRTQDTKSEGSLESLPLSSEPDDISDTVSGLGRGR